MSTFYTSIQLEEARKKRLKQELANSIQSLKEQLQVEHKNTIQLVMGENIETTVSVADNAVSGYNKNTVVTGAMLQAEEGGNSTKRDELDFSELLFSAHKNPTKLEQELDFWIKKADERPIISEQDEKDRSRLLTELAKIIQVSAIDTEDKVKSVKMRVSTYLQGAAMITKADQEKMESSYLEYCTLCEMLEVKPTERLPYRIEKEVTKMTSILEKRRQDEYVMNVIEEIMKDLGCHVKDDAVLEHTVGQIYAVDGHPLCDVFVGNDGSGIMFEPVGESKYGSLERQRQIENSANSICSMYATLEERALEKGVILKKVYMEPANIDEMYVQSDISKGSARKQQRKISTQKWRTIDSED